MSKDSDQANRQSEILSTYQRTGCAKTTADVLGMHCGHVRRVLKAARERRDIDHRKWTEGSDTAEVTQIVSEPVKTLTDLYRVCQVDAAVWECGRWQCTAWTTGMKLKVSDGKDDKGKPIYRHQKDFIQNYRVWASFVRRTPAERSLDKLLEEIRSTRIQLPVYKRPPQGKRPRRALELSIMDPHIGMRCFFPQSDATWSFDEAEQAFMATTERLLELAEREGPYEKIMCPIGNDFMHVDTVFHTTTKGTPQPEADSILEAYVRGEKLMLWFAERLRKVAPLELLSIPGNHDRMAAFTMARLLRAYYLGARAKDVTVDAAPTPYKFWQYGVNLVGLEHGHSINALRLASLMANETRLNGWKEARYCEWHLGDQHRKGSSKPSSFEEQGVSVEYLPGLTPANEWHKINGYNWQKRGAMAFVWDHTDGPVARYQVNFDNYTGNILGASPRQLSTSAEVS
jgi:hypothetical protein